MNDTRTCLLVCIALGMPGTVHALDPQPFEAEYVLKSRGVTVGETRWTLERNTTGFVWESTSTAAGVALLLGENRIVERSEWHADDDTAQPIRYSYQRSGRRDKEVAIAFDWQESVVYNTAGGDTWRMEVPAGTLDKFGYLLVVMDDLAAGKRVLRYDIADGGKLKEYRLHVEGSEEIETSLGRLEAYKVIRERPDSERETTIWMAPSLGFMPLRVEHREPDGESLTMDIRSLSAPYR